MLRRKDKDGLRRLLHDGTWVQGARARTATGKIVDPRSPQATRWCLYGAALRIGGPRLVRALAARIRARVQTDADLADAFVVIAYNDAAGRSLADIEALIG